MGTLHEPPIGYEQVGVGVIPVTASKRSAWSARPAPVKPDDCLDPRGLFREANNEEEEEEEEEAAFTTGIPEELLLLLFDASPLPSSFLVDDCSAAV